MHLTTKAARLELYWRNQGEEAINREMEIRIERYLRKRGIPVPQPVLVVKGTDAA